MLRFVALLLTGMVALSPARAAGNSNCGGRLFVLWGDGRHDDTAALNAWFRGDTVVWGENGRNVGPQIADRVFRLNSAIYITSGTGRSIEHFRFVWPERKELVAGGTVATGNDPDRPPVAIGITKFGAGPNEGVPFPTKAPKPAAPADRTDCLVS
jgi:hypothetical protein